MAGTANSSLMVAIFRTRPEAETALQVPAKARSEISVLLGSLGSGWAVGRAGLGEPPTLLQTQVVN